MAVTGGLVASGEGTAAACPKDGWRSDIADGLELKPKLGSPAGDIAPPPPGGLVAELTLIGGAPELNSAHRGHLRFVSRKNEGR